MPYVCVHVQGSQIGFTWKTLRLLMHVPLFQCDTLVTCTNHQTTEKVMSSLLPEIGNVNHLSQFH